MEAKQISVSRNHIGVRISGIIAVGALFWIDAEDRIRWNLRGRAAGEAAVHGLLSLYHIVWASAVYKAVLFHLEYHYDTK